MPLGKLSNKKVDNSNERLKAELRTRFLPKEARVLDLFCGLGQMYRLAYEGRVSLYHGVDNQKVGLTPTVSCCLG